MKLDFACGKQRARHASPSARVVPPLMTDLAPADIMMEANRVASATTLYEVLGVSHSATEIDIRRKYREVSPLPLRRTI